MTIDGSNHVDEFPTKPRGRVILRYGLDLACEEIVLRIKQAFQARD
jgi:hypothetical protein